MDTTTDTIRDPQGAGSLSRDLCFELLDPVLNDNDVVGRPCLQRPNHQEPLAIRRHRILRGVSGRFVSGGGKEYCRAPDRERQIGIYPHYHEIARRVAIKQFCPTMRPDWLRSAARRNLPLARARIRKLRYIDLVPSALVGRVRQP